MKVFQRVLYGVFCLTLCFFVSGCHRAEISSNDLLGVWTITLPSENKLPSAVRRPDSALVLQRDGTFETNNIPAELLYATQEAESELVTGRGTWKLKHNDHEQFVELTFSTIANPKNSEVPFTTSLRIERNNGSPILFYYHDDEDEGIRIEFGRR